MSVTLGVEVETARLELVAVDVLVTPFFSCDRPLRGPAAWADWRLCGFLSERLQRRELSGEKGEAALIPTGGRMRSPILLVVGLGPRSDYGEETLREVARSATARLLGLRSAVVGIALPVEGGSRLDASRSASIVLEGVAGFLSEHPSPLRLRLVVAPEEAGRARSGLLESASRLSSSELAIRLERASSVPPRALVLPRPESQIESPAGKHPSPVDFRH